MALSINWATQVITVPKADMLLVQSVPTEIRELNLNTFRLDLKDLEDDEEGIPWPTTHNHVAPITVGGVTLARVIEIINGYTVTFEDGQYAVNLAGANSNIGDVVNVNQVSVRSANSAGLTYSKEVEDQSFSDARVWINTDEGSSGTQFPRGTPGDPVDNTLDAATIIGSRSLPKRASLTGTVNPTSPETMEGFDVLGVGHTLATINLSTGVSSDGARLAQVTLTGACSGPVYLTDRCKLEDVTSFEGEAYLTELDGTIELGGTGSHDFVDCWSGVAGTSTPIIDCNDIINLDLSVRRYAGGIELRNISDAGSLVSIDLTSGHVKLASTCTAGVIVVRGVGHITDNSDGATVVRTGLSSDAVWLHGQASSLTALNSRTDNL